MKTKGLFIFVLAYSLCWFLPANDPISEKIEKLEHQQIEATGIKKIDLLNQLAKLYYDKEPARCIQYGEKALELCTSQSHNPQKATALRNIGVGYIQMGDLKKAIDYLQKSLAIYKQCGDQKSSAGLLGNIGIVYRILGNQKKALQYYNEALKTFKELGDEKSIAKAAGNIGNLYLDRGNHQKALEYQLEALDSYEKTDNKNGIVMSLNSIGIIYKLRKETSTAMSHFQIAYNMAKENGFKDDTASALNNMGLIYMDDLKDYPRALTCFQDALTIAREIGAKRGIAIYYSNIGNVHQRMGQFAKAVPYHKHNLEIQQAIGDKFNTAKSLFNIAVAYRKSQNLTQALHYLQQALPIAEKINAKDLLNSIYKNFSILYEAQKQYKKSLAFFKKHFDVNEELFNQSKSKQIAQLKTRYETLKKEKRIEGLEKTNQLLEKDNLLQIKNRNLFIMGFALAVLILVLLIRKFLYFFTFWKKQSYVGSYRLLEKIGVGGMSNVYRAHHIRDKKNIVAVKILKEEFSLQPEYSQRFKSEAAIIEKFDHPHIVKVKEYGMMNRKLYIAMELLGGKTLRQKMDEGGEIDLSDCIAIMTQIADALAFIHNLNILHRDLKPSNIMLVAGPEEKSIAKLMDFGLARGIDQKRITQTGELVGTISYMSPEQLAGFGFSFPGDVFSMGVIFYELLTANSAFPGETPTDVMNQILEKTPVFPRTFRPQIPDELNDMVLSMLAKEPKQRPSAEEVANIVKACLRRPSGGMRKSGKTIKLR